MQFNFKVNFRDECVRESLISLLRVSQSRKLALQEPIHHSFFRLFDIKMEHSIVETNNKLFILSADTL